MSRSCPDCHVPPGQPHDDGCDMARCTACGEQRITCKHGGSDTGWGQIWNGPAPAEPAPRRRTLTLNCSTCGTTGITVWADHAAACPGPPIGAAAEALLVAFGEVQLAEMHAAASARIKQVRALHQRGYEACDWCSTNDRHVPWPCPTIRALDGEETPGA